MKYILLFLLFFLLIQSDRCAADPAGSWTGAIEISGSPLTINVELTNEDGAYAGEISIPAQGIAGFSLANVQVDGASVRFEMAGIPGTPQFDGALSEAGDKIAGNFLQGGQTLTFHLARAGGDGAAAFKLVRPQTPLAPFPYQSEAIVFRNEGADIELAGTFITPEGDGPFPTVLFITGSGPQDRDESLMGHQPFWVIADYLARRGIASLRYDDRGAGKSQGNHMKSTVADFASDANAGIEYLTTRQSVDQDAIGIIGHSEGGLSGPIVATTNAAIDFLVLLAPPGEPLDKLLARQTADILRIQGIDADLIARVSVHQQADLQLLKNSPLPRAKLKDQLLATIKERLKEYTEAELEALKYDEAAIKQNLSVSTTPWFRSLMREDPTQYLDTIRIPTLALFGERDLQVDAPANAPLVKASLEAAGNPDFEVAVLPGLNHLFQHSATGNPSEYGSIEETFAPEALLRIGDWIDQRFNQP